MLVSLIKVDEVVLHVDSTDRISCEKPKQVLDIEIV